MAKPKKPAIIIEEVAAHEEIAELQLERLKKISRDRLLTYEETKIYDILTKNLLLAKGEATTISASSRRIEENKALPEDALLRITKSADPSLVNRSLDYVDDDKSKP